MRKQDSSGFRGDSQDFRIWQSKDSRIASPEETRAEAERLLQCFEEPFLVDGHELYVSASIGAAFLRGGDAAAEEIESRAYAAMACAKGRGRNQVAIFEPSMLRDSRERLTPVPSAKLNTRSGGSRRTASMNCRPSPSSVTVWPSARNTSLIALTVTGESNSS